MSKIIIGVHGVGNKPPKEILQRWWCQALREGFRRIDKPQVFFNFEMLYWADIVYEKPLDVNVTDPKDPLFLVETYNPGRKIPENRQRPILKNLKGYLEKKMDKLFLKEDMTPKFSSITNKFMKLYFKDMEAYYSFTGSEEGSGIKFRRDEIRNRLADTLHRHKGKNILLLCHSMGSVIAYDVMFHTAPDVPVDTLITAGSPQGLPVIIGWIFAERRQTGAVIDKIRTPENVKQNWFNFSDPEDTIAFDADLKDDYAENSGKVRVTDITVKNDYENRGSRNPHKSFGYLRTPEMAEVIYDFLHRGQSRFIQTCSDKINRRFSDFIEKYK